MAFYNWFPWSYDAAYLACMIANMMRDKDAKPLTINDFMPADAPPVVDPEDQFWNNVHELTGATHGEHIHPDSLAGRGNGEVSQ